MSDLYEPQSYDVDAAIREIGKADVWPTIEWAEKMAAKEGDADPTTGKPAQPQPDTAALDEDAFRAAFDAALTGNPEYDMAAKYIANHEAAAAHTNKILDEALRQIDEIVKERDYLDRRCVDHEAALRNIAEGNLGDGPGQANYARIKEVARAALSQPALAQEDEAMSEYTLMLEIEVEGLKVELAEARAQIADKDAALQDIEKLSEDGTAAKMISAAALAQPAPAQEDKPHD